MEVVRQGVPDHGTVHSKCSAATKSLFHHLWPRCNPNLSLFKLKSNQFNFCLKLQICKFGQIPTRSFSIWSRAHGWTDSLKAGGTKNLTDTLPAELQIQRWKRSLKNTQIKKNHEHNHAEHNTININIKHGLIKQYLSTLQHMLHWWNWRVCRIWQV